MHNTPSKFFWEGYFIENQSVKNKKPSPKKYACFCLYIFLLGVSGERSGDDVGVDVAVKGERDYYGVVECIWL